MTRSMKSVCFLGAVLLVALALQASPAAACTQQCQRVQGGPLFCRQCVDTGSFTGVTCANSGPCGCYFVPNTCRGAAVAASSSDTLQDAIFATSEAKAETASTPAFPASVPAAAN